MDKKVKVAFLSFYSGEVYRGVETHVFELANRLSDLGVTVNVYQNGPKLKNSKYKIISTNLKIDWSQNGAGGSFLNILFTDYYTRLVGRFTRYVLKNIDNDTDVIVTTNGNLQVLYARIWSFLHRKKLLVTGHSGLGADDKWNLLMFPDVFVALTKYQSKWAHSFNPLVKIATIPNGVDLKKFNLKSKGLKINLPHPIILSVGALEKEKRLDLIIKAIAKTKASLLLVGKGILGKELNALGSKLLGSRFKVISLSFEDMPKVYATCDLFTYPTMPYESFGIVILEAMASGLPVVANDDPIRREIVGEAGMFVDPTNTDKYVVTLEKALKAKWRNSPRKQAEKFNWDKIALDYKKLFEQIC